MIRPGFRVRVDVYLGATKINALSLDVVYDDDAPIAEIVNAPTILTMEDIGAAPRIRLYPVPNQVADKICAMYSTYTAANRPSSRYHDLVDIVLLTQRCEIPHRETTVALTNGIRRALDLPPTMTNPAGPDWARGYAKSAADAKLDRDLRNPVSALTFAGPTLNPILESVARAPASPGTRSADLPAPDPANSVDLIGERQTSRANRAALADLDRALLLRNRSPGAAGGGSFTSPKPPPGRRLVRRLAAVAQPWADRRSENQKDESD